MIYKMVLNLLKVVAEREGNPWGVNEFAPKQSAAPDGVAGCGIAPQLEVWRNDEEGSTDDGPLDCGLNYFAGNG